MGVSWDQEIAKKFDLLLEKIPVFLREIARDKIAQRAQSIVEDDHRVMISEKDLVDACFRETPFGFHGPMKCDMEEIGIDYKKYGYER